MAIAGNFQTSWWDIKKFKNLASSADQRPKFSRRFPLGSYFGVSESVSEISPSTYLDSPYNITLLSEDDHFPDHLGK